MATEPRKPPRDVPVAPSADEWRAMTDAARDRFLVEVIDALSDPERVMAEGRPHKLAKGRAIDLLGLYFGSIGRTIYLAEELAVIYPGEKAFAPDVLAVLDVPQPEDDERLAWVVADERRGLDFVLEVLHRGDRKKDLEENVALYARLGIPEYFVFDRARQRIHAFRLAEPNARKYTRLVPQAGKYRSDVLGLELGVQGGALRFFVGSAELFGSTELIARLNAMVEGLERRSSAAEVEVEEARASAEEARASAEQATKDREEARASAEQAAKDREEARASAARAVAARELAEQRAAQTLGVLRDTILGLLAARQLSVSDETRRRVAGCEDAAVLQRWLVRAATATSADEAVGD